MRKQLEVFKINSGDVFDDNNDGFNFGLEENSDNPAYIQWFKTEEEREREIKAENFKVMN